VSFAEFASIRPALQLHHKDSSHFVCHSSKGIEDLEFRYDGMKKWIDNSNLMAKIETSR
jgi:hypothetical protein